MDRLGVVSWNGSRNHKGVDEEMPRVGHLLGSKSGNVCVLTGAMWLPPLV